MSRRDLILVLVVLIGAFLLILNTMPRRYAIIDDYSARYYDKAMTSREYVLRKELKAMENNKNISEEVKLDTTEALAKNLWAFFKTKDAADILRNVSAVREKLHPEYNQKKINTMIALAGVYRDLNQLQDCLGTYDRVFELDKKNLPADDPRLVRDLNNLAMADYVRGDVDIDPEKRKDIFRCAMRHINDAIVIWHKGEGNDPIALANLMYLRYLCYRELGDIAMSRQSLGTFKYLQRKVPREYVIPWE